METVETDVLIVGAGGAGLRAAFEADSFGARVALVDKSLIGRGGATGMALMQICASLGLADDDNWRTHFEDTVRAGRSLNNQEMVEALVKEAPERVKELERYGVRFDRLEDGTLRLIRGPGHSRKRGAFVNLHTGQAIVAALLKELRCRPRVRKWNDLLVTRILVENDRVVGAVGLDIVRGEIVVFRAPAVILATGGGSWLFQRSTGGPNLTGDGFALAYRAGAELMDMEFMQFYATATVHPNLLGINVCLSGPVRYVMGGTLYNTLGEQFLLRYTDAEEMSTRDVQSIAVTMEVRAGRGTPHGGVYSDLSVAGSEALEREYGSRFLERVKAAGVDIREKPLEVGVMAHFSMGGVRVSPRCEAGIPGLYAAGEAAAGVHGANRIAGNALSEAFVFGARAGRHAAEHALSTGRASLPDAALQAEQGHLERRLDTGPEGLRPLALRQQLARLVWEHLGPIRNARGIEMVLDEVRRMREEELPRLSLEDSSPRYNRDWVEALEAENMLDVAEMIAHSALVRRESRGAHFREDFPRSEPEWLKNVVVTRRGDEIAHYTAPLVTSGFYRPPAPEP